MCWGYGRHKLPLRLWSEENGTVRSNQSTRRISNLLWQVAWLTETEEGDGGFGPLTDYRVGNLRWNKQRALVCFPALSVALDGQGIYLV